MKKLLIISGKGGTGKTTVSAALIRLSKAKAIADCDVDAPNLHLVMHANAIPTSSNFMGGDKAFVDADKCIGCSACISHCRFNAIQLMNNKAFVNEFACEGCGVCSYVCQADAITLHEDIAGRKELYVDNQVFSTATLKMGRGNSGKLVSEVKLDMLKSAPACELAIIDGSPGIGCPVIASISGMDLVLIVTEPSCSGISDLKRLVHTAETFRTKLAVCVNKYDTNIEHTHTIQDFCHENHIAFVGNIPFDKEAIQAVNSGYTLADIHSPASIAIEEIYQTILKII